MQNDNFLEEQIGNIENSIGTNIKIRTLDGEFQVKINVENKVEELKKKIEDISKVPKNRQRLIFRGKLLKDSDALSFYKITELDVVHLVAKTAEQRNEEESEMSSESNNTARRSDNSSMLNLMNRIFRLDNSATGADPNVSLGGVNRPSFIPAIVGRRPRRNGSRDENISFNTFECKEAIFQNFEYLNNLKESSQIEISSTQANQNNLATISNNFENLGNINMSNSNNFDNKIDVSIPDKEKTSKDDSTNENVIKEERINLENSNKFELFDFTKIKHKKGQWIDVKDTIDQWLEAQVIDVKDDKVYIHYNGWGTRWDEWIEMRSDRIKPFRFHTRQTSFTNYQSPYPNVKPDANVNMTNNQTETESFFDTFDNIKSAYNMADDLMNQINNHRGSSSNLPDIHAKQREIYVLSKKLAPILDRLGRSITDVGGYINYNLRNNKLEDLDKTVFDMNNIDSNLKIFELAEQQRIEEEQQSILSNTRETRANISYPVNQFDRSITNQISIIDTPLTIQNSRQNQSQPAVDIYVHTIITPLSSMSQQNNTNNTATNANPRNLQGFSAGPEGLNNPLDFINLLTNSRHNMNNFNFSNSQSNNQRSTPSVNRETDSINNNNICRENSNDVNLLGRKREHEDPTVQEADQIIPDSNNINLENELDGSAQRVVNPTNFGTDNSPFRINSRLPCFDIIVEDCVEGESSEQDYDNEDDGDSNIDL